MRVQDAVAAVRALAGERQLAARAVERGAPLDQFLNRRRTLFHQRAHGDAVAETVAGKQGVLFVQFDLIIIAERDGDAALRVFGGGFPEAVLGDHQHRTRLGEFNGGAQPGHSGSNHEKIRIHPLLQA